MDKKITEDLGEEIISKLKKLIEILKSRGIGKQNAKECPNTPLN